MNHGIIDPYQGEFPEVIEEYLRKGVTRCIAFNRRGTLLAAGCTDGSCVIWDFETRGVSRELQDTECNAPITSVCWSKCGRQVLTAYTNKALAVWDVVESKLLKRVFLNQTCLYARFHPRMRNPTLVLVCPMSAPPILIDTDTGSQHGLDVSVPCAGNEQNHHAKSKHSDGSSNYSPASASFNKEGDLIYVGTSKGEILIIETETRRLLAVYQGHGNSSIKQIVFSKSGKFLLTNSSDRNIRVFRSGLASVNAANNLKELLDCYHLTNETDTLKMVGNLCFEPLKEFHDAVNRHPWKTACFSGDDDWVIAAPSAKGEHKICIWERAGQLVKMLDGPKEILSDLLWHPIKPLVVSVSMQGYIYIWAKDYTEYWSAFAPDFKELEENEEYVEREDEFDMNIEPEKAKVSYFQEEDEDVEILETDKVLDSDSDAAGEDIYYLPTTPLPDSPEPQRQSSGSPSIHEFCTPSRYDRSPPEDEGANKIADRSASQVQDSPQETDDPSSNGRFKRKRKLSEKGAEMQAEKGRKSNHRNVNGSKRKPTAKVSTSLGFSLPTENGSLDSGSKLKSTSKDSAEELEDNFNDEDLSYDGRREKKPQKFKFLNYPCASSISPTSKENGFGEGFL